VSVRQKDDNYLIEGVVLVADGPNVSGNTYEIESLKKAVDEYNAKDPATRLGEVHSGFSVDGEYSPLIPVIVDLTKVSHRVGDLILHDNGTVTTTCEVMNTPMGNVVKDLIESNMKLGVSSEPLQLKPTPVMMGQIHDNVVDDLRFVRVDVIPEESEPDETQ
jgi:hypothetical protein